MSDSGDDNLPLPQGPWGFPGMGNGLSKKQTRTPASKSKSARRHREQQAKISRKANRHK